MFRYAQTNLQLFSQLRRSGLPDDDLGRVADAYALAVPLFSSRFRCSGKPFLAHLVGTASILAAHGAGTSTVVAGLLHAAYEQGEFGTGRPGMTDAKRRRVRQSLGDEPERLVARYSELDWPSWVARPEPPRPSDLTPDVREALFIRLANELEECLDLGPLYCARDKRASVSLGLASAVALARALDHPRLADEIAEADREVRVGRLPAALVGDHSSSFTVLSLTLPQRLRLSISTRLRRLRRFQPNS